MTGPLANGTGQPPRPVPDSRVRRRRVPTRHVAVLLTVLIALELVAGVIGAAAVLTHPRHRTSLAAAVPVRSDEPRIVGALPGASGQPVVPPAQVDAVDDLLDRHASAVLHHDEAALLGTLDPDSAPFRTAQTRQLANLRDVPLASWSYTLDATTSQPLTGVTSLVRYGSAPVWAPDVTLHYALTGFDASTTSQHQALTFVERSGHWYIAADGDFAGQGDATVRNLWDYGPVRMLRTAHTLVLGHPAGLPTMRAIPAVTDAAEPRVTAVWGSGWPRRVVVLVPTSQSEMASILGSDQDLSQIAAVTTAELPSGSGRAVGERIIVNPGTFAKLSPLGRQIVLTHEMTHVATRDVTSAATPRWLAEGFADYIGYLAAGLTTREVAPELARDIRAGKIPSTLPVDSDFDGSNTAIDQAYEQAWLACRLIAARTGQAGLVAFYRAVSGSSASATAAVAAALQSQLGLSTARFTALWRTYVREQLA